MNRGTLTAQRLEEYERRMTTRWSIARIAFWVLVPLAAFLWGLTIVCAIASQKGAILF